MAYFQGRTVSFREDNKIRELLKKHEKRGAHLAGRGTIGALQSDLFVPSRVDKGSDANDQNAPRQLAYLH